MLYYCKFIKEFGFSLFYKKFIRPRMKRMDAGQRDIEQSSVVANWIWKNYQKIFKENLDKGTGSPSFGSKTPIWVFWWQGIEGMLPIVKVCYNSICKNASSNHDVILLTKDNYQDYTDIPDLILEKVGSGEITLTHFSDIIRTNLLYPHGGLWLDATMYISRSIPDAFFEKPFFSPIPYFRDRLFHEDRWSVFAMGGKPGCPLYGYLYRYFISYWKEHRMLVNYIMIDDAIRMMYYNMKEVKALIDDGGIVTDSIFEMQQLLGKPFDKDVFMRMCKDETFHKLTYKRGNVNGNGYMTLYEYLTKDVSKQL